MSQNTQATLYWHDYETLGVDPKRDRAVQFAGVRTDLDLNIIEEPLEIFCSLSTDALPHPEACLVTGIGPNQANAAGVPENQFIAAIETQLARPGTCGVGYNSIRFDDEVTRNILYRNFYDPYEREWRNGNSRWDIIDMLRTVYALRPDTIKWPRDERGVVSFRLERLTAANGLAHAAAHDALSDVHATIALARLIKEKQPELYAFAFNARLKSNVVPRLRWQPSKPVLHISSKYRAENNCLALVMPLMAHPTNKNGVIVYDLSEGPESLIQLSAPDIHRRVFTAADQLTDNEARIALKTIHINRSPIVLPLSILKSEDEKRLGLNLAQCKQNFERLSAVAEINEKLTQVFSESDFQPAYDPDLMIYSGGFFQNADKQLFKKIRSSTPEQLASTKYSFRDPRLLEMLFRYRARNFPESLSTGEQKLWKEHCRKRLTAQQEEGFLSLDQYYARCDELRDALQNDAAGERKKALLSELDSYGKMLEEKFGRVA